MKFRSQFISVFALSLTLSACSTLPPEAKHRTLQENLLVRCPEALPPLTDGTGGDVTITMKEWAAQYHRCATPHNGLVDAIKQPAP